MMAFGLNDFVQLAVESARAPARAVPRVLALAPPMQARWMAAAAVVSLSAILAYLASLLFPLDIETPWSPLTRAPLTMAGVQLAVMVGVAGLIARVGQMFGGQGNFADALWLMIWIDVIMLAIQVVQVLLMVIFPLTAEILGLAAIGLFFWLIIAFTKELHGFRSAAMVAFGLFATMMVTALFLTVLMGALGIMPPVTDVPQ